MNNELDFAKNLATQAGDIMLRYFDGDLQTETKADGSPVTVADKQINHMVIEQLGQHFPDDGVVGEEESNAEYGLGRRWICDPIDGTMAFTWGVPSSMFSLALVVDGVPAVGVAYDPFLKRLYWSVKGEKSYCNGKVLQVSDKTLSDGIVGIGPHVKEIFNQARYVENLLNKKTSVAIFSGAVYRICLVGRGRLVGYIDPGLNPYDIAAGHLIVEGAGGRVTGLDGQPLDYRQNFKGAIISNGTVHQDLLNLQV